MEEFLHQLWQALQPVLITVLVAVISLAIRSVQRWIESQTSSEKYKKMAGIVGDALYASAQKLKVMLADGKLTDEEKAELKRTALEVAKSRFSDLRGIVLSEAMDWAEVQLDAELGKLEARLFGIALPADGQTTEREIGPDDPAV